MRHFRTERLPGGKRVDWYSEPNGTVHRKVTQDAQRVMDGVKAARDGPKGKDMRHLGSVPEATCIQWLKEMGPGYTLYSREFARYAAKKLRDRDWSALATGDT